MSSTDYTALKILEDAARGVIAIMKTVPEFSEAKIAIIGGMALCNYIKGYRTTEDVDFMITVEGAPKSVKEKLLKLPNAPFLAKGDVFFYKTSTGANIQIDMCFSEQGPFVPDAVRTICNIEPEEPLPYIDIVDLLVFKINSCGLRADKTKRQRDATDAEALLQILTSKKPLTLNTRQKKATEEGLSDVLEELGENVDDWKRKLGI